MGTGWVRWGVVGLAVVGALATRAQIQVKAQDETVLTGIEDFVAAAQEPIRLQLLPGFGGLGILTPEATLVQRPELASFLEKLMPSPHLVQLIQDMEQARNWLMLDRIATRREIRRLTQIRPGRQARDPAGTAPSRPNAGDVILEA